MPRWTDWREIAKKGEWYDDELDWEGPACYELATGDAYGQDIKPMYVGETANERKRISDYARSGSHLGKIIAEHLADGWHLYYRACDLDTKEEAVDMQNALLAKYDYDWNIQLNT